MRNSDDDPLDGVPIGQTETVEETVTLHGLNMTPDAYYGNDRFCDDVDIADIEIIETDGENYNNIKVTWQGDVTKRIPAWWDAPREPAAKQQRETTPPNKWLYRGVGAAAFILPFGLATAVSVYVINTISGSMTINGDPVQAPKFIEMAPLVLIVSLIGLIIYLGIERGGFPGKA